MGDGKHDTVRLADCLSPEIQEQMHAWNDDFNAWVKTLRRSRWDRTRQLDLHVRPTSSDVWAVRTVIPYVTLQYMSKQGLRSLVWADMDRVLQEESRKVDATFNIWYNCVVRTLIWALVDPDYARARPQSQHDAKATLLDHLLDHQV